MTDKANNFYYCGKLALKLLIFRLIITYLGTLRMRQIAPFFNKKKFRTPQHESEATSLQDISLRLVCGI